MSIKSVIIYTLSSHENQLPQVKYLAIGLRQAGIETTVAGPLGPTCSQELSEMGVRILLKPVTPALRRLRLYQVARILDMVLRDTPPHDLAIGIDSIGLTLAYLAFRRKRARHLGAYFLEYDPPEHFRRQVPYYAHLIAPHLSSRLSLLIDVSNDRLQQRRRWMQTPDRSVVLRNVPPRSFLRSTPLSNDEVPDHPLRFLYQSTLGPANGLECLLKAFQRSDPDRCTLTLAGYSADPHALKDLLATQFPFGNVSYAGLLPRSVLPEFISKHDIGIVLYPWRHAQSNPGLSLCAPNKLYEYFARGLPVICSDNSSLRFVADLGIGWRVDPEGPDQLAELVSTLCAARGDIRSCGNKALLLCQEHWHFERQFSELLDVIREM